MLGRHSIKLSVIVIAIILICIGGSASVAQRGRPAPPSADAAAANPRIAQRVQRLRGMSRTPYFGIAMKNLAKGSKTEGVQVESVSADSPAAQAGLLKGDIITSLDGKPVVSSVSFLQVAAGLQADKDYQITLLRGSDAVTATIHPTVPVAQTSAASEPLVDVPAPRKGPLDINTLKYVLVDPQTHAVTFIGRYDPDYATGPIPYADILKDALQNPYPSFSIEPNDGQQAQFEQVDRMITSDIGRMDDPAYCNQWGQKLSDLLLNDTSLQADSKRFFANLSAAAGMTGDELKRLYDGCSRKVDVPVSEVFQLTAKLMRGIGSPGAADGLLAMSAGGTPEEICQRMADALKVTAQYQALETKRNAGELSDLQFRNEAVTLCMVAMCREFGAPEASIQQHVSAIHSGSETTSAIIGYMSEQMAAFITNKAGARMLNGLVLGPEVLSRIYNMPVPQSEMVFTNVASDSQLADVLCKADYRLKSVCTYPDAREKIPAHLTDLEFAQKEALSRSYTLPAGTAANIGHRLVPSDVEMRVSPNGDVVEFAGAKIKVVGWVQSMQGSKNGAAEEFINDVTPRYAEFLTQHFDDYAKVYPEWHKMAEAAKLVAVARWAQKNNYTLNVEDASGVRVQHPTHINGFWSAVFQTDGENASLTVMAHGGASFSQNEGEDWLKTQPDVTVTADVSKQLAASAILAGQSVNAAISGDLEAARDLSEKSALAMTGMIDLTQLPSLDGVPVPADPASYAAATSATIEEASECLKTMDTAQKDLTRASQLAATSPDEAAKLSQQATEAQDKAQARLKEIMDGVSTYRADPVKAGAVVASLRGSSGTAAPIAGGSSSGGSVANNTTSGQGETTPVDWSAKREKLAAELEEVNKKIASTRNVLLKLSTSVQADAKLFAEWEKDADDGFDRCVGTAADVAIDFGAGALSDRYETIHELAKKLPDNPEDLIEKYRHLAALAQRMKEAKSTSDLGNLASRENKTEAELFETIRDGIGQISGLLGLDKTLPGALWKYGSLASDMAYNLTELRQLWKNTTVLEQNNVKYAEAVKKLSAMMQKLIDREKELKRKIEAGDEVDFRETGG